jgi:hypothetical protein
MKLVLLSRLRNRNGRSAVALHKLCDDVGSAIKLVPRSAVDDMSYLLDINAKKTLAG